MSSVDPAQGPVSRRERRKLEVRSRIYVAAQALFTEKGFDATTVDEIAEDAGASIEDVEFVLTIVQEFDPLGVGARNLRECLLIQQERLAPEDETMRIMIESVRPPTYPEIAP